MTSNQPPFHGDAPLQRVARAEYALRMNRVLDYIDTHLDTPLELSQLADVANFSRFHFHRIFAGWMGETLGDYARRRRLEVAAQRLSCGSGASVLATALACGFGSGEAFARAFKLKFGCTPTAWRAGTPERQTMQLAALRARQSNLDQADSKHDQAGQGAPGDYGVSSQPHRKNDMQVRVIDLPQVRIAFHRHIGPYGAPASEFWRDKMAPWIQSNGLEGRLCFGVGHDDPSVTSADKCRYDACVAVPDDFRGNGMVSVGTLPGGRYAVAQFKGRPASIGEAWMTLMREWLPSSGLQCDERPCFEQFAPASALDPLTGEFSCELCIPVRAL
ncbi:GyrI-like domain-containing protein [Rugamonas sp. CCM 8940]|uniref:AraC family transcriptional regulator n=1 Tax=Rugamonas sp. CCM 8940 TaxID=2765359 RepID=UPI0018F46762|nr:GyrI-like domain-containing protein [Rugamonas sp. CCM 8940]MBJ7313037.1 AraC family transcriptional regulator [Rugamonas sp. CCM 8940]